jgi:CDP-2,3-bis-(O-geranylgeranyl)-sn-glycerol synthase
VRHVLIGLLLVMSANTAAWAAGRTLGTRWHAPLDFGCTLGDGARLFGSHKTWAGLIGAVFACGLETWFVGLGFAIGAEFGALALAADAASSFVKRRLKLGAGSEVPALDQIPEALVPLLVLSRPLGIGLFGSLAATTVFTVLDIAATRLRHL